MDEEKLPPIHPGEILSEEFLIPLGMSQKELAHSIGVELAHSIGVDVQLINDIVRGDRPINAETALLLSRYFDTSAKFWTGLQSRYELDIAKDQLAAKLNAVKPRSMNGVASHKELQLPGKCQCGCGGAPNSGSVFSQGHDQKALHKVIKSEYGSVLEFLQHHGYASND